jgi:FkbM family methyltransferase
MAIKQYIRRFGIINFFKNFNLVKRIYFNSIFYAGPNRLITQLCDYLPTTEGYYLEIGANDGISQSNTNFLERRFGWRGILIEPVPNIFKQLVRNRSSENTFWNVACCSFDYNSSQIEMTYGDLMSVSHFKTIDLDPEAHIAEAMNYLASNDQAYRFLANAKTLQEILTESMAPSVMDFFSLDVEGAEFEVLNGIDFDKFNFRFILVESRTLDRIKVYLESKSYVFVKEFSNHDYLFRFDENRMFENRGSISMSHL